MANISHVSPSGVYPDAATLFAPPVSISAVRSFDVWGITRVLHLRRHSLFAPERLIPDSILVFGSFLLVGLLIIGLV